MAARYPRRLVPAEQQSSSTRQASQAQTPAIEEDHSSYIQSQVVRQLNAYRALPDLIAEHAELEEQALSGGYGRRQVYELVQNAADALAAGDRPGKVEIILDGGALYCANEGSPLSREGIRALLMSHLSPKREDEIGRFGLGFKSVLGVCEQPEVFSTTCALRFNPVSVREELMRICPDRDVLPRLRIAAVIDAARERQLDPILDRLLDWATTVVRLRLIQEAEEFLEEELRRFPALFLVFAPHVASLTFDVAGAAWRSEMRARASDSRVVVYDGEHQSEWAVFSRTVDRESLPNEAVRDMDRRLRDRRVLPLHWAAPVQMGKRKNGELWAFFPTQDEITLQGILNAPWKTNADRENLLDGPFNRALLESAAGLIASSLDALNTGDDPARFLDALPARDPAGWADEVLTERLTKTLGETECMPTAAGERRIPEEVSLRPDGYSTDGYSRWATRFAGLEAESLAHLSAETRERRGRARRLGCDEIEVSDWLTQVARSSTPAASIAAIQLADVIAADPGRTSILSSSRFVLTAEDRLVRPDPDLVSFAPEGAREFPSHVNFVHPEVAADPEAKRVLSEMFGIGTVSSEAVLRSFLKQMDGDWHGFWDLVRGMDPEAVARSVREVGMKPAEIRAKSVAGPFERVGAMLLVGRIVTDVDSLDHCKAVVDPEFHASDQEILEALGASATPRGVAGSPSGRLAREFAVDANKRFRAACRTQGASNPQSGYVVVTVPPDQSYLAPVDALAELSGEPAVRLTQWVAELAWPAKPWEVRHRTRPQDYPKLAVEPFAVWVLRRYGWASTALGPFRLKDTVGEGLSEWSHFLPVLAVPRSANELLPVQSPESLSEEHWEAALERTKSYTEDVSQLTSFYALAGSQGVTRPDKVRCRLGDGWANCPPGEVTAVSDRGEFKALEEQGRPVLYSPRRGVSEVLSECWGLERLQHSGIGFTPAGDAIQATDRFSSLAGQSSELDALVLQPCEDLWREIRDAEQGLSTYRSSVLAEANRLFYVQREIDSRSLLRALRDRGIVELEDDEFEALSAEADEVELEGRKARVKAAATIAERLIAAVGIERLRSGIPQRHLDWLESDLQPDPTSIAELSLAVHGIEVLKQYRDAMSDRGLQPPRRWAGSSTARSFVRDLGFPEEYAGFPGLGREPWEDEHGPSSLPPLHPFQDHLRERLVDFLCELEPGRGILSLPTGAGKTRIAIQSLIEWMRRTSSGRRILWIAGSDELCEQAVESWIQAWRSLGPERAPLRVNRLWGSTNDRVRAPDEGADVVVATFQSLVNRVDGPAFDWVFDSDAVIIDEAHGAVTPSYTRILDRLGLTRAATDRPLIGLTATPFRGGDDESETMRLAFRFAHTRFDLALWRPDEAYSRLQQMGVLARADHERLEGVELHLSEGELEQLERFGKLPASVEMNLGRREARNERIFRHLEGSPPDWPVLLFATSTEHSEDLAVRLTMRGIPARSITGETPQGLRRHAVSAFKNGDLRVLTNYGVFTTGFDAPAVRAVYVTRPVYSPLLYQQMIGRGLRGPKNGGKERCLIVNVEDNLQQYGEHLAFHRFSHLWRA